MLLGAIRQRILRAVDRRAYVGVLQTYQNAVRMLPLQCDHAYISRRARQVDYAQAKKDLMRESSVLLNGVRRTLHSQHSYRTFLRALYTLVATAFADQREKALPKEDTYRSARRDTGSSLVPPPRPPALTLDSAPAATPLTRGRSQSMIPLPYSTSHSPRGSGGVVRLWGADAGSGDNLKHEGLLKGRKARCSPLSMHFASLCRFSFYQAFSTELCRSKKTERATLVIHRKDGERR